MSRRQGLWSTSLYQLLFDGADVALGSVDDPPSLSRLAASSSPPLDASVVAPRLPAAVTRAAIERRVQSYFLPYAFDQAADAGAVAPRNVLVIGGESSDLSPPPGAVVVGVAPLDCGDTEARNLGWVFSDSLGPSFGGVLAVAATAAHELGHMVGLEHDDDPLDPMYAAAVPTQTLADRFQLRFGAGPATPAFGDVGFRCNPSESMIDNHARLLARLGAGEDRGAAPVVTWAPPLAGMAASPVAIDVSVAPDDPAVLVEVWRNFELYAVLDAPPFVLDVPLDADVTFVTIDAFSPSGRHTAETRRYERVPGDLAVVVPTDAGVVSHDLAMRPEAPDESCACRSSDTSPTWSSILIVFALLGSRLGRARTTRRRSRSG